MPYTPAQHRLFEAAAHDPRIAMQRGIPTAKATQMAAEGVKPAAKSKALALARALNSMKGTL